MHHNIINIICVSSGAQFIEHILQYNTLTDLNFHIFFLLFCLKQNQKVTHFMKTSFAVRSFIYHYEQAR